MQQLNAFLCTDFVFSPRYRVWRHIIYWSVHISLWATFWLAMGAPTSFGRQLFNMLLWVPLFVLFSYPLIYGAIPYLLLKGKVTLFFLFVVAWGIAGLYLDTGWRSFVFIPIQESLRLDNILPHGPLASCYLCMTTSAIVPMMIRFYKLCTLKQREWLMTQQEKLNAEAQLLKAQVHPEFLFNTLHSIHSSAASSPLKTPGMILKLSSLLSYMLYDCKADEVRLEKELEMMRYYIELEVDRHNSPVDISWSVEGNVRAPFISPLLLLPFLENAIKHGLSQAGGRKWLSIDVSVQSGILRCKIANSKCESVSYRQDGTGITHARKRLDITYPGRHELKLIDEGSFFVSSLSVRLSGSSTATVQGKAKSVGQEAHSLALTAS